MSRVNLDLLEVPNPCSVPWDSMQGDDRVRHCSQCQQSVYQLSNLSRDEVEALILEKEGKLCVQFYRRADGSVVTRPCVAVRMWRGLTSVVTFACLGVLTVFGVTRVLKSGNPNSTFLFRTAGAIAPPMLRGDAHPAQPAVAPPPREARHAAGEP
jgi:hypothetical protein